MRISDWSSDVCSSDLRRLRLRPFEAADAAAVEDCVGRWEIARMTTRIAHPYPKGAAATWIAGPAAARAQGSEHSFAITLQAQDQPIGAIRLRHREHGHPELGSWLAPTPLPPALAPQAATAPGALGLP